MFATVPDLLRLLIIPVFAWAALRDVRTRRLPNRIWPPLYAAGLILLAWETIARWPLAGLDDRLFLVQVAVSLLLVVPLAYAFWYLGAFGGADAKALIAIAVLLPTFPTYIVGATELPVVETPIGVFSMTVLTNTVLVAVLYPLGLVAANLLRGSVASAMLFARPVTVESLPDRHGRLFETREGFTRSGLDLDTLRMYLRWRGTTLAALREDPERFVDPDSVGETHDPTDGGTHVGPATDGGTVGDATGENATVEDVAAENATDRESIDNDTDSRAIDHDAYDDPWAAERFLEELEGSAYGATSETLQEGLAVVADRDRETVWVSPGMPFVVPMFLGLVVAFTYGDVLFAVMDALGLA